MDLGPGVKLISTPLMFCSQSDTTHCPGGEVLLQGVLVGREKGLGVGGNGNQFLGLNGYLPWLKLQGRRYGIAG